MLEIDFYKCSALTRYWNVLAQRFITVVSSGSLWSQPAVYEVLELMT